ncbi:hypothetical protein AJ78_01043 [Emergomyces pasteurianus Ep9510]|uniref:Uncharacterized protein n=1 Tax=Emergomyces pasteurianus Ep9510 TaxID=1447872 RepID=A0A1J9QUR6_9EURO|nr:hypothetical protein AJ78_01043 [Emergomyces pasteurianus Ep9510]
MDPFSPVIHLSSLQGTETSFLTSDRAHVATNVLNLPSWMERLPAARMPKMAAFGEDEGSGSDDTDDDTNDIFSDDSGNDTDGMDR